ncbi:MAG: TIM barrel protein [Deltaproteobacteria bacterium]|jgi:sugar phosphate isomerase/epimerase|nr:TIM barrel protein [Deltaproteobacteria bacterium]
MTFFATTHIESLIRRDAQFKLLKKIGFFPEVYFESAWEQISPARHKELASLVLGELSGSGVHLPYRDILPGKMDTKTLDKLKRATEIANLYQPRHLIGHAIFRRLKDSLLEDSFKSRTMGRGELTAPISTPNEAFLNSSVKTWLSVLENTDANLFLENTSEASPYPIVKVLEALAHKRAAMCLDIGHWHFSGMGSSWNNLPQWMEIIGDQLGHLHLHDNDGDFDQHLPMGKGTIDFGILKELLAKRADRPTATVENHIPGDLIISARYLEENFLG